MADLLRNPPVAREVSEAVKRVGGCYSMGFANGLVLPFAHVVQSVVSVAHVRPSRRNSERSEVKEEGELGKKS
jgi:hypothetical protein